MDDRLRIVVDSAERRGAVYRVLADLPDVAVETARLAVADYLLGGGLAVERKTGDDFASSIIDRRLFAQVAALKEAYARPIILLEGAWPPTRTRMHPNALRGALSYLVAIEGISVLRASDAEDSALLLVQLARHAQRGLRSEPSLVAKPTASRLAERQERVVAALPEVGPTLARQLLAHFGSAAAVLAASETALRRVAGIGPARAAAIRGTLDAAYEPDGDATRPERTTPGWLVPAEPGDERRRAGSA